MTYANTTRSFVGTEPILTNVADNHASLTIGDQPNVTTLIASLTNGNETNAAFFTALAKAAAELAHTFAARDAMTNEVLS